MILSIITQRPFFHKNRDRKKQKIYHHTVLLKNLSVNRIENKHYRFSYKDLFNFFTFQIIEKYLKYLTISFDISLFTSSAILIQKITFAL